MPLKDLLVIELAGLAPGPFTGLLLADFGARVIRVDKLQSSIVDVLSRGKQSICLDLKKQKAIQVLKRLLKQADVLIDPFRPGILEKLGLDPILLLQENPRLIIARLTGYGQTGVMKHVAGHDLNYTALSGVLSLIGSQDEPPPVPTNILSDFAGGSLICSLGILIALHERNSSNKGQIIDVSMVEGALFLSTFILKLKEIGSWNEHRKDNLLDGGAPFYQVYKTLDNKYLAVGCIEPQFYSNFVQALGFDIEKLPDASDKLNWPKLTECFRQRLSQKTRDEWMKIFDTVDACVTPVLETSELMKHPYHQQRKTFHKEFHPLAAPRLSRTPANSTHEQEPELGEHTVPILLEFGYSHQELNALVQDGVIPGQLSKL